MALPPKLRAIERATEASGFTMASDHKTGSLLRTLAASKPGGNILELGTGTGLSTCWLLDGLGPDARLVTVDNDPRFINIAKKHLSDDVRVEFVVQDGADFLRSSSGRKFDLIFADAWPGKYWDFDLAFDLLADGGLYLVDDMLPRASWPENHPPKVAGLIGQLEQKPGCFVTKLNWSTGIIVAVKAQ